MNSLLNRKDVSIWMESGRLYYDSQPGSLTPDDLAWLQEHRQEVALHCLERDLDLLKERYHLCVDFEYKPFRRALSPSCIKAGKDALRRMEREMFHLSKQIQALRVKLEFLPDCAG